MNFILTKYIYPIMKKVCISKKFGVYLDNPRSDEEIESIKRFIKSSNETAERLGWAPNNKDLGSDDYITIENTIKEFKKNYCSDINVKVFFQKNDFDDIYGLLAKMWVIARYNDEGELDNIKEQYELIRKENIPALIMIDDKSPISRNSKLMKDYCCLLSLLINTDKSGYSGQSFLMDTNHYKPFPSSKESFHRVFTMFMVFSYSKPDKERDKNSLWELYPYIIECIVENSNILNSIFNEEKALKKLMFVANMLKVAGEGTEDYKLKVVTLVSIIEMLLTRNPDNNKFNVEDSINKQFQLKASTVVYLIDRTQNISLIKEKLKLFYSLRSCIAHGNFESIEKIMKKVYEIYKEEIDYIDSKEDYEVYYSIIISELYTMITKILKSYLEDRDFIEFLKES